MLTDSIKLARRPKAGQRGADTSQKRSSELLRGMPHSCRNAFTGSIKLARRAGTKLASSAARISSEIIIA
jgi:hypothetical protein